MSEYFQKKIGILIRPCASNETKRIMPYTFERISTVVCPDSRIPFPYVLIKNAPTTPKTIIPSKIWISKVLRTNLTLLLIENLPLAQYSL